MTSKKTIHWVLVTTICFLEINLTIEASNQESQMEKQEYKQDISRILDIQKSFSEGKKNNLSDFERFADELQGKWKLKNKENHARLMLEVCSPLSSGKFKEDRRYEVARRYALSALDKPEEIPLDTEIELTGHVITLMIGPNAPKGQDWEELRRKDVEIRLHAWKRLLDSIDPAWDPNDLPQLNVAPPAETGLPAGVDPQAIQDPALRAKYEMVIEANKQKIERYNEQYKVRKWLEWYPKRAEEYIVRAYSKPPYNNEELEGLLEENKFDKKLKTQIIDKVTKNIKNSQRK